MVGFGSPCQSTVTSEQWHQSPWCSRQQLTGLKYKLFVIPSVFWHDYQNNVIVIGKLHLCHVLRSSQPYCCNNSYSVTFQPRFNCTSIWMQFQRSNKQSKYILLIHTLWLEGCLYMVLNILMIHQCHLSLTLCVTYPLANAPRFYSSCELLMATHDRILTVDKWQALRHKWTRDVICSTSSVHPNASILVRIDLVFVYYCIEKYDVCYMMYNVCPK